MKTFVLLHGAWHGAWCWNKLISYLEQAGHKVITPDLPGHGKDNTPISTITLQTYVDHVVGILNQQKTPVVLVGHSMSGGVISQVAELIPHQIENLVYLAAFVPNPKGNLVHEQRKTPTSTNTVKGSLSDEFVFNETKNEVSLKKSDTLKQFFYNTCDDMDATWAVSKLQPQPFRPFIDCVNLSQERFGIVPKLYIECLEDQAISIENQRRMQAKINCEVKTMNTDHSPFLCQPFELSKLLG